MSSSPVSATRLVAEECDVAGGSGKRTVAINDALVSVVGAGLGALLAHRGERTTDLFLQALVPVALPHQDRSTLGNRIAVRFLELPVGPMDAAQRLAHVAERAGSLKKYHEELASEVFLELLSLVPHPVLAAATAVVHYQPLVNLVITNVPGPPFPVYAFGARMLESFPFIPLGGNLTVGVAALSYDGALYLGMVADPRTCPDLDVLVKAIDDAFAELLGAARARS